MVFCLNPDPKRWPGGVFLKKYFSPSPMRFFLRRAKSQLEAANYQFLSKNGFNVPAVIAAGENRRFGCLTGAFLLTKGIPNVKSMEEVHQKYHSEKIIFMNLANIIAEMHKLNFYHIDLQWRNILIQDSDSDASDPSIFIIDCPRGAKRFLWFRKSNGKMHDLAGLEKLAEKNLSRTDRLRWYKIYTGHSQLTPADRKMIRNIRRQLQKRRARYE
jgi:tRNA A-37 threonylcarbamoyl transferase component Bud32